MEKLVHDAVARGAATIVEETSAVIADRLTLDTLGREGKVTLQEAAFFKQLAKEVLTESIDQIIPDEVNVPEAKQEITESTTIAKETKTTSLTESEAIVNTLIQKLV